MMTLVTFVSAYRRRIAEKGSTEPEQKEDKTVSREILSPSCYSILVYEEESNGVHERFFIVYHIYIYTHTTTIL